MSMRRIYRKIAREYGVSVAEVKADMQSAIDYAWLHTPDDGVTAARQAQVTNGQPGIPRAEQVIRWAAGKVTSSKKKP